MTCTLPRSDVVWVFRTASRKCQRAGLAIDEGPGGPMTLVQSRRRLGERALCAIAIHQVPIVAWSVIAALASIRRVSIELKFRRRCYLGHCHSGTKQHSTG